MKRDELQAYLQEFLETTKFEDYGPNGLQVQGKKDVEKLAFAVSATRDSIIKACAQGADALIVHHGLFWSFHGPRPLVGPLYQRLAPLIKHDINLFGFHLPLDAHLQIGNAKSLADLLNLKDIGPFGNHQGMPTGVWGCLTRPVGVEELARGIQNICQHPVIISASDAPPKISTLGIITGGANGDWTYAHKMGLDAYLTGEISEHDWHEAKESGITMFAAGHHATEQFGIQNLMAHLQEKFPVKCFYIDSPNPA